MGFPGGRQPASGDRRSHLLSDVWARQASKGTSDSCPGGGRHRPGQGDSTPRQRLPLEFLSRVRSSCWARASCALFVFTGGHTLSGVTPLPWTVHGFRTTRRLGAAVHHPRADHPDCHAHHGVPSGPGSRSGQRGDAGNTSGTCACTRFGKRQARTLGTSTRPSMMASTFARSRANLSNG